MIDEEFAFLGPSGFDLGAFIANLVFALIRHIVWVMRKQRFPLLQRCIPAAIDYYCSQCGPDISDSDEFVATALSFDLMESNCFVGYTTSHQKTACDS